MNNLLDTANKIADAIIATGDFELVSSRQALPLVTVKLKGKHSYTCHDLSEELRLRGWIVPAYTLPPKLDDVEVLRIVVREGFSRDMADNLILDLTAAVAKFDQSPPAKPTKKPHSRSKNKVC